MEFEEQRKKYVLSQIEISEKIENQKKIEKRKAIIEIRELKLIKLFIEENIKFHFIKDNELDISNSIDRFDITSAFIKYCKNKLDKDYSKFDYELGNMFQELEYLGPYNNEHKWIGISFKNEEYKRENTKLVWELPKEKKTTSKKSSK